MKISESQLTQAGQQSQSLSHGERSHRNISINDSTKVAAGEQVVLSREASLKYEAAASSSFESSSVVSVGGEARASYGEQQFLEELIKQEVSGAQAVSVIRSIGAEEAQSLSGEVSIQFSEYRYYHQEQSAAVSFSGDVTTEDGRSIGFTLHLAQQQSQSYSFSQEMLIERRPLNDPLVINFGTDSVKLSSAVFEFDVDSDGDNETMKQLASGSGFLALDRNRDGEINNGHELFGADTGNGFSELAFHDNDNNGWIDENDAVFNQLQVMVVNHRGEQELHSLRDVGVGAIHLGSENTALDMMDGSGRLLGAVKRTGIFLMENGQIRTMQEIDLADLKTLSEETEMSMVIARGEPLQQEAETPEVSINSPETNALIERFAAMRTEQEAFRASLDGAEESSEVSFIRKLFEQIEIATEQYRSKGKNATEQYLGASKL